MKQNLEQIAEAARIMMRLVSEKQWRAQIFTDRPAEDGAIMLDSEESSVYIFFWEKTGLWSARTADSSKHSAHMQSPKDAYLDLKRGVEMQIVKLNTLLSSM